jgi:ketosteroid isomerase-like protein
MNESFDLIRKYFAAYEAKDRESLEALLADGFTFSSPLDDNISRANYLERCWPNSAHQKAFHIEKLSGDTHEIFVTYECETTDSGKFRNTEFFVIDGRQIKHVDVYFGSEAGNAGNDVYIRELVKRTVEACRTKDAIALMANYADDVVAYDLITPLRYVGADEVEKRAAQWFASFEGALGYDAHDPKISAGDNVAFCHSLNHVVGTSMDGQQIDMWWRATLCCAKRGDRWLITHAHSSVPFDMKSRQASLDLKPS